MIRPEAAPVGTKVTYDDEPNPPTVRGVIVEPTAEELALAKSCEDPVGPEAGDVLVEWDDEDEPELGRYWEHPSYLVLI